MGTSRRVAVTFGFFVVAFSLAQAHGRTRQSLSFRQSLPNSKFITNPPHVSAHGVRPTTHPNTVAKEFIEEHVPEVTSGYYIRNDSYTDQNTGISHVYARQIVNGLEVVDGDVNLNIRGDRVLSYGSSVFGGIWPEYRGLDVITTTPGWSQDTYCAEISPATDWFACEVSLNRTRAAIAAYPSTTDYTYQNPRAAAYFFIIAAYPESLPLDFHIDIIITSPRECRDSVSTSCWTVSPPYGVLSPIHARLAYIQSHSSGHLHTQLNLVWRLEVEMKDNYYEAYVSAQDPSKIIAVADWVKDGPTPREDAWPSALQARVFGQTVLGPEQSPIQTRPSHPSDLSATSSPFPVGAYRVWKWGISDPASENRSLEMPPYDQVTSPLGWHSVLAGNDPVTSHPDLKSDNIVNYTTTVGNNVIAQSNWAGGQDWKNNPRPDGGPNLTFAFPYGANPWDEGWETVEPRQYVNASITQLFYVGNMYHNLLYLYGFDEASGNFQQYNFGKGGVEGDGVIINAQDGSGFNNANFLTPPDGQNGRCRMYIWNTAKPFRDGGLDASILVHELSHGLSTRLTGGPSNSFCMDATEAAGMGEGWSDFIATTVRSTSTYSDYPVAAWASNTTRGIRHFPYAINMTVNPLMYDYLQRVDYRELHAIGEIWAEILWVVSNILIDKHGFADSLFPTSNPEFYRTIIHEDGIEQLVPKQGNTLMLQLVVTGMKIQPCKPTFLQARDAIIAADRVYTGGENECLLWSGFASRGLGTDAQPFNGTTSPSINGFGLPDRCK